MSTKLQETINGAGGNIKPMLDELKKLDNEITELEDKKDEILSSIAEKRAKVKAMGVSKKAFDFARKRKKMDEDKRDELDDNYSIACEALGVPLKAEQGDMFATEKGSK